eukprot:TRINITY_DN11547_c0_g1_i2.p2 TRINITY_DN11547_c0_g1~~TRINITY_DN11547_c0_g1_i2.p2  ORF type:complete len:332 (-),score=52.30 TRINITY_DN11547_c0_g1_i2:350-1345(-)
MSSEQRIDPCDGHAYDWDEFCSFYAESYTEEEIARYWKTCTVVRRRWRSKADTNTSSDVGQSASLSSANSHKAKSNPIGKVGKNVVTARRRHRISDALIPVVSSELPDFVEASFPSEFAMRDALRDEEVQVTPGYLVNLPRISYLSKGQLDAIFRKCQRLPYRRWAGRAMLDFKIRGAPFFSLTDPYKFLNPLVAVMISLASRSLRNREELALMQLLLNYYPAGSDSVKAHRHPCRQICVSLGAPRELEVEGQLLRMCHGDALHLDGEMHSVPPADVAAKPRLSLCLFYASIEQCVAGEARVLSNGSFWWTHPEDSSFVDESMMHKKFLRK